MSLLKTVMAVILVIVALTLFGKIRQKIAETAPARAANIKAASGSTARADNGDPGLSPAGFFLLDRAAAGNPRVTIMSPPNCPSYEAQLASALEAALNTAGIPTEMKQELGGSIDSPEDVARINKYMTNVANPLVIVRGWAKGNPTAADVIAQYRAGK
jgi:hypothetical protein